MSRTYIIDLTIKLGELFESGLGDLGIEDRVTRRELLSAQDIGLKIYLSEDIRLS